MSARVELGQQKTSSPRIGAETDRLRPGALRQGGRCDECLRFLLIGDARRRSEQAGYPRSDLGNRNAKIGALEADGRPAGEDAA